MGGRLGVRLAPPCHDVDPHRRPWRRPSGTLTAARPGSVRVTLTAGGRGIDQDGNGTIDSTEGVNAALPRTIVGSRDGLWQTTIALMLLVRQIQASVGIDGHGSMDLDARRVGFHPVTAAGRADAKREARRAAF
jgi:hypothetical protein